jgi:hypothetical protein
MSLYRQSAAVAAYIVAWADSANRHVVQTRGYFVKLSGSDSATSVRSKTVSFGPGSSPENVNQVAKIPCKNSAFPSPSRWHVAGTWHRC